jgi:integrase/recombinase XerD
MNFEQYLQAKRYSPATISRYRLYEEVFTGWLSEEQLSGEQVTYNEVIAFMRHLHEKGKSKKTIHGQLNIIRHYFNYLIAEGQREDNPAAGVYVRGIVRKLPNNLLNRDDLEELYRRYQLQLNVDAAKKIMLGLLIYQGMQTEEITRLEAVHIHLKEGKIFVKGTPYSNERWLPLQAHQVVELQQYLQANRFKEGIFLARPVRVDASARNISNRMKHMIVQLQKLNPRIINANQIRNSVITFWLQQHNLRQVQYMAGHKYVSSTERYQVLSSDDWQSELQKHHPMSK